MDKEALLAQKEGLQNQIADIDNQLTKIKYQEEAETLHGITDKLNSMFQNPTLEKFCQDECNELYDIMQRIDKVAVQLEQAGKEE